MTVSTASGWEPVPGQLVIERMWSPMHPEWDCPLAERIANGQRYGTDQVMRLSSITENYDVHEYRRSLGADLPPRLVTRWHLVDPDRPNDESRMSWVDSDWAELLPTDTVQVVEVPLW